MRFRVDHALADGMCMPNTANTMRSNTPVKFYSGETFLERLAQGLEHVAAAFGSCIQEAHAVVRPRHVPRRRHVAPADPSHIGDHLVRGATWARHHQRRTLARQAGDVGEAGGRNGFGQHHRRQDGDEAAYPHSGEEPTLPG
jgi:hypothetical protein